MNVAEVVSYAGRGRGDVAPTGWRTTGRPALIRDAFNTVVQEWTIIVNVGDELPRSRSRPSMGWSSTAKVLTSRSRRCSMVSRRRSANSRRSPARSGPTCRTSRSRSSTRCSTARRPGSTTWRRAKQQAAAKAAGAAGGGAAGGKIPKKEHKAEFSDVESFAKKLQSGIFGDKDATAKEQLKTEKTALQVAQETLKAIKEKKPIPGMAVP